MTNLPARSRQLVEATPIHHLRSGFKACLELTAYPDGHSGIAVSRIEGAFPHRTVVQADSLPLNDDRELYQHVSAVIEHLRAAAEAGTPEPASLGGTPHLAPRKDALLRAVRGDLESGFTPDQVYARRGRSRAVYLLAIEEEARLEGELGAYEATPEQLVKLRDGRRLRWERIAARVFGEARRVADARRLYEEAKGAGAARRSYTGRGRRFDDMTN